MSCYIVSKETMNEVMAGIRDFGPEFIFFFDELINMGIEITDENGTPSLTGKGWKALGRELFRLNHRACEQRYGQKEEPYPDFNTPFGYERQGSKLKVLKRINCLLYQMSEGDVPNYVIFSWLEKFSWLMSADIVRDLDAYDKAPWN